VHNHGGSLQMLNNYPNLKKAAYRSGVAMILVGVFLSLGAGVLTQFGVGVQEVQLLPGESLVHTFVRFLVLGCMLCALGSSD
jgi:hypothetical protein